MKTSIEAWCDRVHVIFARIVRIFAVLMMLTFIGSAVHSHLKGQHWLFVVFQAVNAVLLFLAWLHMTRWIRVKTTVVSPGEHWQTWKNQDIKNVRIEEVYDDDIVFVDDRRQIRDKMPLWDFLIIYRKVDHPLVGNP